MTPADVFQDKYLENYLQTRTTHIYRTFISLYGLSRKTHIFFHKNDLCVIS